MNQLLTLHKFLGRIRNIQGSALPHQNREDSVGQYAFEELDLFYIILIINMI